MLGLLKRALLVLVLPAALAACGAEPVWAPDDVVARATYVSPEPPSITLFTVARTLNGEGAHAGLLINGSQRVLFDPAGTWEYSAAPERNDVHFGMTPAMRVLYIDYHVRPNFYMVEQTVQVSPEVAERALNLVMNYGAVPKAFCANSVSVVLRDVPGFQSIPQTFFPGKIMKAFAEIPGVRQSVHRDGDPDIASGVVMIKPPQP